MALGRSYAISLVGIEGTVITVEAHLADGVPSLSIIGLPDASLQEARDRVRAALVNSGEAWPSNRKVTIGLSPAAHPKRGSGFDLAIVGALLAATGVVPLAALEERVLLGELGLDGSVRSVPGVLPALSGAQRAGFARAVVPLSNLAEAELLPGLSAQGVSCLRSLVALLRGSPWDEVAPRVAEREVDEAPLDFSDVAGQPMGRLACLVAAAGGHNLLMTGPPGCGKTLLSERLPGILPRLSVQESLDVTMIHSVAGVLPADVPLISAPPFQAPHHGSSAAAIIGGGLGIARPGAASLPIAGCCSSTRRPSSTAASSTRCGSASRAGRSRSAGSGRQRPTPPGSPW